MDGRTWVEIKYKRAIRRRYVLVANIILMMIVLLLAVEPAFDFVSSLFMRAHKLLFDSPIRGFQVFVFVNNIVSLTAALLSLYVFITTLVKVIRDQTKLNLAANFLFIIGSIAFMGVLLSESFDFWFSNFIVYIPPVCFIVGCVLLFVDDKRHIQPANHCPKCLYQIIGVTRCPECGTPYCSSKS